MDIDQSPPETQPLSNPSPGMTVRLGTCDDLDSLVDLGLAAMPMDPQWDYRYPHRLEYPDEHRVCIRQSWARFFRPDPGGGRRVVLFVDYKSNASSHSTKPISFSVSHFPSQTRQEQGHEVPQQSAFADNHPSNFSPVSSTMCGNRRDWNPGHVEAFRCAVRAASDGRFASRYGEKQAHLQILGTHPGYQRRGAASALLRYGIKQAREEKLPITLFASHMGQPLYARFGFEDRGTVVVQVDGEEIKVTLTAMALEVTE
ncbi:unnamed protein product [Clonostachys rosea]|uniref:N-acetyltransferase domain-containing protein n=1 Tax=Bionectria ochroleuca TaxID=29856 RepID=A0ABY6TQP0_BIOOC|nr:unnamed protein product [Clonostachys rosea]